MTSHRAGVVSLIAAVVALSVTAAAPVSAAKPAPSDAPLAVTLVDRAGVNIDLDSSGVEISRVAPTPLAKDPFATPTNPDDVGFRPLFVGPAESLPTTVEVVSRSSTGKVLDTLRSVPLREITCPPNSGTGVICATTVPLRLVLDDVDRTHPLVIDRSMKGELEGHVSVATSERELFTARVLGPRSTPVGAIDHLRGTVRVVLVRDRPGGAPPFGADEATAIGLARIQIAHTNMIWGQCGIDFGPADKADIKVIDPPQGHMIAVGCDLGSPASGGEIKLLVDKKEIKVSTHPGDSPRNIARDLERAIETAGFRAQVSENARIGPGALATTDLVVRRRTGGALAHVTVPDGAKASSDPTLNVCIGRVDPSDGLQHFSDVDAVAGSLEERSLLKAIDDGDPTTIEVVFVTSFSTGGRIGESFIRGDRSSLTNMMIVDRAGVRADQVSFALAHELGHVLLDVPGHSDDYGLDTPTRLMDSDSADATVFGPRRLTAAECARAVRQSGPVAPTPLLRPWTPSAPKKNRP